MSQASENIYEPLQVQINDHQIVAVVCRGMQDLLANNHLQSETFVRQLFQLLPSLTTVAPDDLPAIARIHLQSATHIGDTMKLIAPEAYSCTAAMLTGSTDYGSTDDIFGAAPTGGLAVAASSPAAAAMLTKLIDLQIFHLVRAREATAHMRMHAAVKRRAEAVAAAAAAQAVAVLCKVRGPPPPPAAAVASQTRCSDCQMTWRVHANGLPWWNSLASG